MKCSNFSIRFLETKFLSLTSPCIPYGVILTRLKQAETLERFVDNAFNYGAVRLVNLPPQDLLQVVEKIRQFGLDFDDAYQFVAAEKYGLTLVSFDKDFDSTNHKRKTPREILEK
jgi:predicted nucleic acid-binding protein